MRSVWTRDTEYPRLDSRPLGPPPGWHSDALALKVAQKQAEVNLFIAQEQARQKLASRGFAREAAQAVPQAERVLDRAIKFRDSLLEVDEVDWAAYERATADVLRLTATETAPVPRGRVSLAQIASFVCRAAGLFLVFYAALFHVTPDLLILGSGLLGLPTFWSHVVAPDHGAAAAVAVLIALAAGLIGAGIYGTSQRNAAYAKERQAAYSRQIQDYRARQTANIRLQREFLRIYDESRPKGRLP